MTANETKTILFFTFLSPFQIRWLNHPPAKEMNPSLNYTTC